MTEREQWFHDRIGKRVWRNDTKCCDICEAIFKNGFLIQNDQEAAYLYMAECDYADGGEPLQYFDTQEEALAYEAANPTQTPPSTDKL